MQNREELEAELKGLIVDALALEDIEPGERSLESYYEQELAWSACGDNECATLDVPISYQDLSLGTIELALERATATGERVGSLVVNPGGPGGSGSPVGTGSSNQPLTGGGQSTFSGGGASAVAEHVPPPPGSISAEGPLKQALGELWIVGICVGEIGQQLVGLQVLFLTVLDILGAAGLPRRGIDLGLLGAAVCGEQRRQHRQGQRTLVRMVAQDGEQALDLAVVAGDQVDDVGHGSSSRVG